MTSSNWVGKTLSDRYKIEELLGQGGMSAVYKATDPNLNRIVAIKMIHPHLSADKEFVSRFEEEAKAVAQLRHPNIIQVYDFNKDNDTYYMVLEFVPGETLQERLERYNEEGRRLPLEDAARFTMNISEAAGYAHKRGMIHRDIKPANVMLNVQNQAILMDFGIAKIVGGEKHTATGAVVGTAIYLSPEQIRGEVIDARVDVYATGVAFFEMLSGNPPYQADSAMTLLMKHLNDPIPDLRDLQPEVPDELVAVVEKALAKDRDQRFLSSDEMASALKDLLDKWDGKAPVSLAKSKADQVAEAETVVVAGAQMASSAPVSQEIQQIETPPVAADSLKTQTVSSVESAAMGTFSNPLEEGATVVVAQGASQAAAATVASEVPVSIPSQEPQTSTRKPNWTLIGGGIAVVVVMLCAIVGGVFAFNQFTNNGDEANTSSTQTAEALALVDSPTSTPTNVVPTDTPLPTATATEPPPTLTPTSTLSPTPTIPVGVPYAVITGVDVEDEGNYIVEFELHGFTDQLVLDGYHLTFFFDNVPADQVGSPHETLFYMYAGPSPFNKFNVRLRAEEAENMCVLVTQPDHVVVPESGTCFELPGGAAVRQLETQIASTPPTPTPFATATKEKQDKYPDY